jgi:hypothetical protein
MGRTQHPIARGAKVLSAVTAFEGMGLVHSLRAGHQTQKPAICEGDAGLMRQSDTVGCNSEM